MLARSILVIGALCLALGAGPVQAGKLDNAGAAAPIEETQVSGTAYFSSLLPLTAAVMAEKFADEHAGIGQGIDASASDDDIALQRALVNGLIGVAVPLELQLLSATDAANRAIIDGQNDYLQALLDGEGVEICAIAVFDGAAFLVEQGLYRKYAALIDVTLAAYFEAVREALDAPLPAADFTPEDGAKVVAQMDAQGDKALMDHFAVMERDSPENCPAVLAIIAAVNVIEGDAGPRVRAAQARGASRL